MDIFDGRYEQEILLGKGAFSEVWKVRDTQTGVSLALKIYNPATGSDERGNEMLMHEFALMVNANHKNLLRPLFFATCEDRPYLILPYCQKGNINKMIGRMTEDEAWKLIRDTASALSYLHAMNPPVLHQDIKPANILMSDNGDYMLTDFGISMQVKQTLSRVSAEEAELFSAGTISYMAPERFSRNNLPIMANDIYSLGATAYEMLAGVPPFGNNGGLLQKKGADIPELQGEFSPMLQKVIDGCLQEEPWNRPSADALVETAERALRHPKLRNAVPAKEKEEVQAKATTIQIPEEYLKAAEQADMEKNKVQEDGSSKTINSSMVPTVKPKWTSKKPVIYGIAGAVVLICLLTCIFIFSGNPPVEEEKQPELIVINEDSLRQVQEQQAYEYALSLFNQNIPDSAQKALVLMEELANKGNKEAIIQMANTYSWQPNNEQLYRRKRLLGWPEKEIIKPESKEIKEKTVKWLNKAIDCDSADYKYRFILSIFYMHVNGDKEKGLQFLMDARERASKCKDSVIVNYIDQELKDL